MSKPTHPAHASGSGSPSSRAGRVLDTAVTKVVSVQGPAVQAYINRVRRGRPEAKPAEIVTALNRYYLSTVSVTGGAAGAAAVVPGAGIPGALLDLVAFTEASAIYALALAEVHGVPVQDLERRRTLLMGVLLGNSGSRLVERAAGRTGAHWGKVLTKSIPTSAIKQVNKILGHNFVTRYGTRQGILVIGKQAPMGIGAAIGAGGNAFFGYGVVKSASRAFGPPPAEWSAVSTADAAPEQPLSVSDEQLSEPHGSISLPPDA